MNIIGQQTQQEIFLKSATSSKYISISKKTPSVFGFNNESDLIGKTNLDISPDIAGYKIRSCIAQLDSLTFKNKRLNCLEIIKFADGSRIKSSQRELVSSNKMIMCSYHNLDNFKLDFLNTIILKKIKLTGAAEGVNFICNDKFKTGTQLIDLLSPYYREVAYLLMIGLSLQDIANIMDKIQPKTDGSHRNRITIDKAKSVICEKLNLISNSREQLSETLYHIGYYNFIPERIFHFIDGTIF